MISGCNNGNGKVQVMFVGVWSLIYPFVTLNIIIICSGMSVVIYDKVGTPNLRSLQECMTNTEGSVIMYNFKSIRVKI